MIGRLSRDICPLNAARNWNPRRSYTGTPTQEEIRQRAYEIYEARGREEGNEADDWFTAERELTNELGFSRRNPGRRRQVREMDQIASRLAFGQPRIYFAFVTRRAKAVCRGEESDTEWWLLA